MALALGFGVAVSALPGPADAAPRFARSIDVVAYQAKNQGAWFSVPLAQLSRTTRKAEATFAVSGSHIANRRGGRISPMLVSSYVFLQLGEVTPEAYAEHARTAGALFIRSALMSFVDYAGNRVLGWDRRSVSIPADVRGLIGAANARTAPVFLELNYSDHVPGPVGAGVEGLVRSDNLAATIAYLRGLADAGLGITGVTFGDEWGDENGFGDLKPTVENSDLVGRFISWAQALKKAFPSLRIYAFDSELGTAEGVMDQYWAPLARIHRAEVAAGLTLIDGFVFRESYVYIDHWGKRLSSQRMLDDTESLHRSTPVYRYDTLGYTHGDPDLDSLHTLITKTRQILGRTIDIGITEYLPAGPYNISESDTSRYPDIDFLLHWADVVGIYAELGLDVVSSWMLATSTQQAEAYVDTAGNRGLSYPVREQLATSLKGTILRVTRSVAYEKLRVNVYAAKSGSRWFVMVLNKDVAHEHTVRITLPGQLDLVIRLPRRSFTSLSLDAEGLAVSGIGN